MSTQVIAPLGFFTYDAFRAGWYFLWRMCLYTLPAFVVAMIGVVLMVMAFFCAGFYGQDTKDQAALMEAVTGTQFWIGIALIFLGSLGGFIASIPLTTRIARTWALRTWNRTFESPVWWSITWRVFLVSLLVAVIGQGVNVVIKALTSPTASEGSTLLGGFLSLVVALLNLVVTLLSYGWAMSRVAASRIGGLGVATAVVAGLNPLGYAPTMGPQYTAPRPAPVTPVARAPMQGTAVPVMAPRAPTPPPPPPASGSAPAGRRQCPKCNLYETEKGTVLGWYCKVCGWSESRA